MGHFLSITVNDKLYIKDPQSSELGQKILKNSIILIDDLGLDSFTFRKLADRIESTEASVYRYFENKQKLFLYLFNWYWEWLHFMLVNNTLNVSDPRKKLHIMLMVLIDSAKRNLDVEYIDEDILHRLVIVEGAKGYHSKYVDEQNLEGFFMAYKEVCQAISNTILEIKPEFPYAKSVGSMILEVTFSNIYFSDHLPKLTNIQAGDERQEELLKMLEFIINKLLS